jgi:hypothetical protein
MARTGGGDEGGPGVDGRSAPLSAVPFDADHRRSQSDGDGDLIGSDHGADVTVWHPVYQHEVAVVARLRHVSCPDGCDETPAVVLRIDNADDPGEIAMTADDVSAMIEGLVDLRRSLLAASRERSDR